MPRSGLPPGLAPIRSETDENEIDPAYEKNPKDDTLLPVEPPVPQLSILTPSNDQLVEQVKGIYTGLVSIETKIIEVHKSLNDKRQKHGLSDQKWQVLYGLHKALLQEHYDFYLVTDHPAATPVLRRLPEKYNMPARMWKYAIHIFLELMRENLPTSREYLLSFLYFVYGIVGMLYETVPSRSRIWTECLGDLSRYRMAIENQDEDLRQIWCNFSKSWYRATIDMAPTVGRLYHHMAILSRPNLLAQLFFYSKSLCTAEPFKPTHESIKTLFNPVMELDVTHRNMYDPVDIAFVAMHGSLFAAVMNSKSQSALPNQPDASTPTAAPLPSAFDKSFDTLPATVEESLAKARSSCAVFLDNIQEDLSRRPRKWIENGMYIALSNICALYQYQNKGYFFRTKLTEPSTTCDIEPPGPSPDSPQYLLARTIFRDTLAVFLKRTPDPSTYSFLEITLLFLTHLAWDGKLDTLADTVSWATLEQNVNQQMALSPESKQTRRSPFPRPAKQSQQQQPHQQPSKQQSMPLPDDYNLRGYQFAENYFPDNWYCSGMEELETLMEKQFMQTTRSLRIISLVHTLSFLTRGKYIVYDSVEECFKIPC
ncbi:hypothetical protein TD95_005423 [Thielaviopsis punctulata]|uniref:DNA/RNA-binding domain-containing protein n=1 Tax=Thielaviopsis punctulata TaxID=72032 RepID=A0A0F4ZDQ1_9PEZI|nr:hypothetical protein TD95_005423 [Thielaviopsis punctulata]